MAQGTAPQGTAPQGTARPGTAGRETAPGTAPGDERLTTVGLLFESAGGLRRLFQRRFASERSLSNQSFDVLIRLARSPGSELRMSELAAQTSLTPSAHTSSVDRLHDHVLEENTGWGLTQDDVDVCPSAG